MVHRNYRCVACNGGHWFLQERVGEMCGKLCAMGGLLEEMEEGRFTGVCGGDVW